MEPPSVDRVDEPQRVLARLRPYLFWPSAWPPRNRPGRRYPYLDGDFLIIGPECFTLADDTSVISYRGQNYVPQPNVAEIKACRS